MATCRGGAGGPVLPSEGEVQAYLCMGLFYTWVQVENRLWLHYSHIQALP